jgi:hypothetical protein
MQFRVISRDSHKYLKDVQVGDELLCDNGLYMPVKNKLLTVNKGLYCRLSNGFSFHVYSRIRLKTKNGFKLPELWDIIPISTEFEPSITTCQDSQRNIIFYDLLIDGNLVSPEGIVFKYGD